MSNGTLAARISALVDKWNGYKNALRDLLTKATGTVDMEDGLGVIVTLPTFPQLQKSVNILTDSLTGAVSQAQSINSQTVIYMNAAAKSATDSDTARAAAVVAKDASKASADASATSASSAAAQVPLATAQVTLAKGQVSLATDQVTVATAKAVAADTSAKAAAGSATAAGTQATTATTQAGISTTKAGEASASATAANTSQNLALNYANAAVNVEVTPGQYSARHWAEQARLNVLGSLVFKGRFDASKGSLPASPNLGDFYLVSIAGTISSVKYGVGDMLFYDGSQWDRIDNQTVVQSVAGRTGNVTISTGDVGGLQGLLDAKQGTLGFNPVQQGTGIGQTTNTIKIGWSSGAKLKVTVDSTDLGNIATENWAAGVFCQPSGNINNAYNLNGVAASNYLQRTGRANTAGLQFDSSAPPNMAAIDGSGNNRNTSLQIGNAGNTSASAMMSFIREGQCGVHFGLDTDNVMKIGGWSFGATTAYRMIHEGVADWYCTGTVTAGSFAVRNSNSAWIDGNGSGAQMNGTWYRRGEQQHIWANSAGWVRAPRTFVQSADPGSAAGEGDLWIW
ncbi:hypothetical protein HDE76_000722 [Rhodanobacter sp. ANJX3]|uniref:hypothetical protein n=1 Tax=Rhodanobacter sp. ANJX3 TaxID=2723083 RepID=UPI00160DBD5C|nr:hypothetical protein [Rhodanobacter sp. ANJX3]MBB5357540.1 hypothetical protein [Rhodanobacter sp. ANJX3]